MTDLSGTVEVILEFVELAIARRKQPLSSQARSRADALDQTLRDLIDGARPAPRRIEGHAATGDVSRTGDVGRTQDIVRTGDVARTSDLGRTADLGGKTTA